MRLVDRRAGRAAMFVTESRFVTEPGRSHPVENGCAERVRLLDNALQESNAVNGN